MPPSEGNVQQQNTNTLQAQVPVADKTNMSGPQLLDVNEPVQPSVVIEPPAPKIPVAKILKIYILPLVIVIAFTIIWIYLVFPKISEIFNQVDESVAIADQIVTENGKLSALYALSSRSGKISSDLALINKVAPIETTQVVEFQQKIIQLAKTYNLLVIEAFTQNRELVVESEQSEVLGIIEIPSEFTMRGKFNDIRSFIQGIDELQDFVIIGEMTLSSADDLESENLGNLYNGTWVLGITLVKYQFQSPDESNDLETAYSRVPATVVIDEDVMNFVYEKYGTETTSN